MDPSLHGHTERTVGQLRSGELLVHLLQCPACRDLALAELGGRRAEAQPTLTPAEWQVMRAVWELGSADAKEVSTLLQRRHGRTYLSKTAGIFLARLVQKGFLRRTAIGPNGIGRPAYLYAPSVDPAEALQRQIRKFFADYSA